MSNDKADQNEAGIPGWRIMRSDTGRYWATREQAFSRVAEDADAFRTVDADDLTELTQAMAEQESIADLAEIRRRRSQPIGS